MRILIHFFQSPARVTLLSFAALTLLGAVLLALPAASESTPVDLIDALFTATSAVCVTGLVVFDTGRTFSRFGEITILALIQAGGLGIMTLSTWFVLLAGKRVGLTGRIVVQDAFTHARDKSPASILKDVILLTLLIEGVGAVMLFFCFLSDKEPADAFFSALFHAVSAFCNAGFSLFPESFTEYRENWGAMLVLCALIIAGGLGFLVLSEIKRQIASRQRIWARISLHSKIALSSTALLLIAGTLGIAGMEWQNTLAPLTVPDRFLSAFFQSVNARTSGFNSLPMGNLANETLFFLIILMFIGASPGSCGGGIKTTTFMVIAVLGLSRLRGHDRPQIFGRSISAASVGRALSVIMISTVVVCLGLMALLMSEIGDVPHPLSRGNFLEFSFESVSAFGTVGLSTGITGGLSDMGKLIVAALMFVGRLGPLVVAMAVSRPVSRRYHYAEETIMVG